MAGRNSILDEMPVPSFTETPEFRAAVDRAVNEAAPKIAALTIAELATKSSGGLPTDVKALLDGLALAIAEMSHQGSPRDKPVDPAVLAERRAGQERMDALIAEARALPRGDPRRPKYKTRSKQNLSDHMIDPWRRNSATKKAIPVEFRWLGEPNDAMIPLNEMAERIYVEFRASRGNKKEYEKQVRRQAWLSDGGLLIEGTPPMRREVGSLNSENDVLDIGDPYDPNASHVRVLGTIHKPARQYNAENPI